MISRYIRPRFNYGKKTLQINADYEDGYCYGFKGDIEDCIRQYFNYYPELKIKDVEWRVYSEIEKDFITIRAKSIKEFVKKFEEIEDRIEWSER